MGSLSIWHWLILGAVVLLLFGGKGKISDLMGDFAKGIKSFKKGLADDETPPAARAAIARSSPFRRGRPGVAAVAEGELISALVECERRPRCLNSTPVS